MIKKKGGEAIASGGYGCVFNPMLKCNTTNSKTTKNSKTKKNQISKLMIKKNTLKEYKEIELIKKILIKIPNYSNYFLIKDITICKPAPLTKNDLNNFTKKCSALPKNNITKNNINKSLDKLLVLNMPNGGIPVDDFIYKDGSYKKLYELNLKLIELLNKGIIPMNKKNIYHSDIKHSNMLVDNNNSKIKLRLIDWGLTTKYIPKKNNLFPRTWRNKSIQYNIPFSVIIFTDDFINQYTKYINDGGIIDENNLKPFVINYIYFWFKKRGTGHYKLINYIMYILFNKELDNIHELNKIKVIEKDITIPYISNYIIEILIHFTKFKKDGILDLKYYLDTIFINIIDIWGFIITYFPILNLFYNNYDNLKETQIEIFNLLKSIFIKYLYSPRITCINITELNADLKKLNILFEKSIETNLKLNFVKHDKSSINLSDLSLLSSYTTEDTTIKITEDTNTNTKKI